MKRYKSAPHYISAEPMTRAEYNTYRGWTLPDDENGSDEGFLISDHSDPYSAEPHISWLPHGVFMSKYSEVK